MVQIVRLLSTRPIHKLTFGKQSIREALDLDPIPTDLRIPRQGPTRPQSSGGKSKASGNEDSSGRGGGGWSVTGSVDLIRNAYGAINNVSVDLAGTPGGPGALTQSFAAMAGYTTEEFAALQAQIGKTDAMQAAAQRMDNLTGDWEVFGGVLEAVGLQVGAAFQAPARAAVQGLTQLVSAATPLLLQWADAAASFVTPYVEGIVTTLTDPTWQADVSSQVTAFWENFTTNNRVAFNLGDVLDLSLIHISEPTRPY